MQTHIGVRTTGKRTEQTVEPVGDRSAVVGPAHVETVHDRTATSRPGERLLRVVSIMVAVAVIAAACASDEATSQTTAGTDEIVVAAGSDDSAASDSGRAEEIASLRQQEIASLQDTADAPASTPQQADDGPLLFTSGKSLTFGVEVVVAEAGSSGYAVGDVVWSNNCYHIRADGTISGPGLPEWSHGGAWWQTGTWEVAGDGSSSSYVGRISSGANLGQTGSVTTDAATGELVLTADTSISIAGILLVRLASTGRQVDTCFPTGVGA